MPTITTEDLHAKRWREWQLNNEYHERKAAHRARWVFTFVFLCTSLWFGFQLLTTIQ